MKRVLFIVKCRGTSYEKMDDSVLINDNTKTYCLSSGLFNSANFVNKMLTRKGIDSKIVQVVDNNCIDREVHQYKPTHVIIEALWVVPEKFNILRKLHPNVKWIIRLHSEMPFLSNEGNAMNWILEYIKQPNILIAPNTKKMTKDIKTIVSAAYGDYLADKIIYLPNYYEFETVKRKRNLGTFYTINIGCFGSIRPLKNQLIQAVAAIEFAKQYNLKLRFHINSGRIEHGNNALKNIKELFDKLPKEHFELVEHGWLPHDKFLSLVRQMDVCLQVSFSETQNIVTCDAVSQFVPVVVSKEIFWTSCLFKADTTSVNDIVRKIRRALWWDEIGAYFNYLGLKGYNKASEKIWLKHFKH